MASLRTRLQLTLVEAWQHHGPLAWLLLPLSMLHYVVYRTRAALYALGLLRQTRLDVPVVVIGNLYLGGTGKTPLTIELVRTLAARGFRPGIVSRGYGARRGPARMVNPGDSPHDVGDEPVLMAQATQVPVAVGRERAEAGQCLRARHPECDVLVADDGLQHWALARDMEIALLHSRGLGNGWMLPAGPLREPRSALHRVDAVVCHGDVVPPVISAPCYSMHTRLGDARPLVKPGERQTLSTLAEAQQREALRIVAAAGVGMPDRFFAMLRAAGLHIAELPLADHFPFATNPFTGIAADRILITEKDAVKCVANPVLATDTRIWVVSLVTEIDPRLVDAVVARLHNVSRRNALGPSAA